jgi:pimeloyl-ACP methyl ester carboxylesterase
MTESVRYRGAGLSVAATVSGDPAGRPAILLHGGGQTRRTWDGTVEQLVAAGWRTIALDMRGHGDSDWAADGDYGIEALVGDLQGVVDAMEQPPVLIGASLGGLTALVLLGRQSDAGSALVLVDVAAKLEAAGVERIKEFMLSKVDGFDSLDEVADAIAAYNPHRPRPSDLSGLAQVLRKRDDGRWYWHWDPVFMGADKEISRRGRDPTDRALIESSAKAITVPTLLVRGRQSDLLSEEGASHLLELIPHARYVDVAGAGHMVAGDRNDAFAKAVTGFLADLDRV